MRLKKLTNPLDKTKSKNKSYITGRTNASAWWLKKFRLKAKNKLGWLRPKWLLPKVRQ